MQVPHVHGSEFFGGIAIFLHGRVVDGQKGQRVQVKHPHGQGVLVEEHLIALFGFGEGFGGALAALHLRLEVFTGLAQDLRAVGHQHLQLRHLEFGLLQQPPLFRQRRRQLEHFHRVERLL